jgi:hypothetical protein
VPTLDQAEGRLFRDHALARCIVPESWMRGQRPRMTLRQSRMTLRQ